MSRHEVLDGHILNIILNHEIREQTDLQKQLKARGHDVPQATLSRHLKRLKIAKVSGIYKVIDFETPHLPLVLNLRVSEFGLIVMHTYPGSANSLAYWIDHKYVPYGPMDHKAPEIIGTVAGDDTVLLVLKKQEDLEEVLNVLYKDFPYLAPPPAETS